MDTFYLDNNNNLIVTNNFVLKSGLEAIKQDAKTLLLMFQTENPLFLPEGIEWYNLANENNLSLMQNRVRQRLLEDDRIKNVRNIQLAVVKDKLQIKATIYTTEGVIDV